MPPGTTPRNRLEIVRQPPLDVPGVEIGDRLGAIATGVPPFGRG